MRRNKQEHSIPWFWPAAAAIELGEAGMRQFLDNVTFIEKAEEIIVPPPPEWATANFVRLDLDTMRLRDFSRETVSSVPVLIDAPYAGHSASIADFAGGQSLVQALQSNGIDRLLVTDWKSATADMRDFDIDKYLAEINVVVDDLGGRVHLVGLCQGGWMSTMFAARFPSKVASLVLAGSPIDTMAGDGPLKAMVQALPASFYDDLVVAGGGVMRGRLMLAGWKDMHPGEQYLGKFLDLYQHIEDRNYVQRTEAFERWYENPLDLPGTFYLQAIHKLFVENRLAKGEFIALGKTISLRDIHCPAYLLGGSEDDITPKEQVFAAEKLFSTPHGEITKAVAEGGHIGLFMGRKTLAEHWPVIARWINRHG